jgi:hypothetical protein
MGRTLVIFVLLIIAPVMEAQSRLELLPEAVVQRERLWLSDLLPAEASTALRSAAAGISLGRSPEVGSFRVFTRAQLRAEVPDKIAIGLPEQVVVRRGGGNLEIEHIRQALASSAVSNRIDFSKATILFPREILARTYGPQLEVTRLAQVSDRHFSATLRCRERNACGAFLAEIELPEYEESVRRVQPRATSKTHSPARVLTSPTLVRPGILASLVMESDTIRIRLRVLPLRKAALGETVRVVDSTTHRVLLADVTGEGMLALHLSPPGAKK